MSKKFELSGVYIITNKLNGKFYVGSGGSIFSRWFNHTCHLKNGTHVNSKLQLAYDKYGLENFKFEILELHEPFGLNIREQFYLDSLCKAQEYIRGEDWFFSQSTYNIKPLVEGTTGLPQKRETIIKGIKTRGYGKVLKVDVNGCVLESYDLQSEAADDNNLNRTTVSNNIKKGRCPKDKNYYFVYEQDYNPDFKPKEFQIHNKGMKGVITHPEYYKEVYCYDIYGRFFRKFESNISTAKYFNVPASSISRMLNKPKIKVLHRHGVHLYNMFSTKQEVSTSTLDSFRNYINDGNIEVYTLFHEYMGSYCNKTISMILDCHLSSVSQSVTQQKILKGFYFIK